MRHDRAMAGRSTVQLSADLRARLEVARLDLLALFRALDGLGTVRDPPAVDSTALGIGCGLCGGSLGFGSASRKPGSASHAPRYSGGFGAAYGSHSPVPKKTSASGSSFLDQLEVSIRGNLLPAEAYNMVPGRDPQNG